MRARVHAMPQYTITEMNSTDRLSTSIVDKNDRSTFQSQRRIRQHSTDLYAYGTYTRVALVCMNVCVLYSAS